ncbi:hypothetical protein FRC04_003795 [Tulasnella sp. 424]|nr:hypothetical protein FRC04_003795 [Tulasnella sp. 424]KAG8973680.1 hypothetical protein FRC05_008267 [Tulasnella sp. 425]
MDANANTPEPRSKPLPDLPPAPEPKGKRPHSNDDLSAPPLPLAATLHLRRLLSNALNEEHIDFQWLPHLEDALQALISAVRSGSWITGSKQRRLALRAASSLQGAPSQSQEPGVPPTPSNTEVQDSHFLDSDWVHADEGSDKAFNAALLAKLDTRIAESVVPAPASIPTHLVITLAPQEPAHQFPDLGIDFDLRPHREGCTFAVRSFSLPFYDDDSGARHGSGGQILVGFEEWKAIAFQPSMSEVRIVGGGFTIKGLQSKNDFASLTKVLQTGLEAGLFKDYRIPLKYSSPSHPAVNANAHPASALPPPPPSPAPKPNRRTKASSGLWNFLSKKTEGILKPLQSSTSSRPETDQDSTVQSAPHQPANPGSGASPISVHFPNRVSLDLVRTISQHIRLSSTDHEVQDSSLRRLDDQQIPTTPVKIFSKIVARLADDKLLLSTSPDVRIPPPSVLIKLAKREQLLSSKESGISPSTLALSTSGRLRLTGEDKVALNSLEGWNQNSLEVPNEDDLLAKLTDVLAFVRHQSICVLYSEHVPVLENIPEKDATKGKPKGQNERSASPSLDSTAAAGSEVSTTASEITMGSTTSGATNQTVTTSDSPPSKVSTQAPTTTACLPPTWKHYQYFSQTADRSLGEFVLDICQEAETGAVCDRAGCGRPRKDHRMEWVHAGAKVTARVGEASEAIASSTREAHMDGVVRLWSSCKSCNEQTEENAISDTAFNYSFAKYLELMFYSTSFAYIHPTLCEHTTQNHKSLPPADLSTNESRTNVRRHFQYNNFVLTLDISTIRSDLFEVRMPRVHIIKSVAEVKREEGLANPRDQPTKSDRPNLSASQENGLDEDGTHRERDDLRLEITYWWSGLKDHLIKLEDHLAGDGYHVKAKRLPTTPDDSEGIGATLKSRQKPDLSTAGSHSTSPERPIASESETTLATTSSSTTVDDLPVSDLLSTLRQSFQQTEQSLYKALAETPDCHLNDVRRKFRVKSEQAKRKLEKWQANHGTKPDSDVGPFESGPFEPGWWAPGHHLMPKSRVIVREKDWGSIVAYTLSSPEYIRELSNMAAGRTESSSTISNSPILKATSQVNSTPSSISLASVTTSPSLDGTVSALGQPQDAESDPEEGPAEDADPPYSAIITRKEHPKDAAGILGLRDVLRNQRSIDSSPHTPHSSGFSGSGSANGSASSGGVSSAFKSLGNSASKLIRYGQVPNNPTDTGMPPNAWARAELELSLQPARGEFRAVSGPQMTAAGSGGGKLSDILAQAEEDARALGITLPDPSTFVTASEDIPDSQSTLNDPPPKLVKTPSTVEETEEGSSTATATPRVGGNTLLPTGTVEVTLPESKNPSELKEVASSGLSLHSQESTGSTIAPPVPPKDRQSVDLNRDLPTTPTPLSRVILPGPKDLPNYATPGTSAGASGSITSTVASAIRYVLGSQAPMTPPKHLGLLSLNPSSGAGAIYPPIDDRPHLKYQFSLGKRARFSCTVYFARQFDFLRKRCNVDSSTTDGSAFDTHIVRSLERCVGWEAEGGKSKSSFLKTEDDRFIIKTLVNAWNVADLQVLLELAPSYFRYMDMTASQASVLAKLMGFYTVEVQTLDPKGGGGSVKMKADLLVMENLFWNLNVAPGRTFDLKGIAGRKVKQAKAGGAKDKKSKDDASSETERPKGERRRVKAPVGRSVAPMAVQKPLYDNEWIEGQQKTMVLVEPHSKAVLKEAIRNDAEFLAKSNIMDYSLLLGLDKERRQIACGLVDTIGSYTFAKTLEYKAKQGLTGGSGREITVVPPVEYQDRFINAMEGYFVACPDKWGKGPLPLDDPGDTAALPTVL